MSFLARGLLWLSPADGITVQSSVQALRKAFLASTSSVRRCDLASCYRCRLRASIPAAAYDTAAALTRCWLATPAAVMRLGRWKEAAMLEVYSLQMRADALALLQMVSRCMRPRIAQRGPLVGARPSGLPRYTSPAAGLGSCRCGAQGELRLFLFVDARRASCFHSQSVESSSTVAAYAVAFERRPVRRLRVPPSITSSARGTAAGAAPHGG
jgi:hypothetical protein